MGRGAMGSNRIYLIMNVTLTSIHIFRVASPGSPHVFSSSYFEWKINYKIIIITFLPVFRVKTVLRKKGSQHQQFLIMNIRLTIKYALNC